ncbi:helix-turn-helix domain-containing protein [Planomonospora sp. ID91781]|uniref:helix-turn-helix domain-containing protein n=1 Tax=Planomonospora sp. ID91781 TaxID=2738135 RepID=UPI0018C3B4BF|nr:helix-turn-helix transcriptional regulator [Planomonospora sp. ID91781]MBG0819410.1 helix-turn-helix domain-containing protein [Planomonospora sp. ID91781]
MPISPTARRRRLGIELRRLREASGLNGTEVAATLGWSATKVSRIETGRVSVHHGDVSDLLDHYKVNDDVLRRELVALARESRQKGWWHRHRDTMKAGFDSYIGFEADAEAIRTYEVQVVPGLLQTEAYARAVIEATAMRPSAGHVEKKIGVRLARQQLLTRDDPIRLHVVLDEAALVRVVGGLETMNGQLASLLRWSELPNVTIQVLPFRSGAHPAMDGPFVFLEFPDPADPDLVYLEQATSGLVLEDTDELAKYRQMFENLTNRALIAEESVTLISSMISS